MCYQNIVNSDSLWEALILREDYYKKKDEEKKAEKGKGKQK